MTTITQNKITRALKAAGWTNKARYKPLEKRFKIWERYGISGWTINPFPDQNLSIPKQKETAKKMIGDLRRAGIHAKGDDLNYVHVPNPQDDRILYEILEENLITWVKYKILVEARGNPLTIREAAKRFKTTQANIIEIVENSDSLDRNVAIAIPGLGIADLPQGDHTIEFWGD